MRASVPITTTPGEVLNEVWDSIARTLIPLVESGILPVVSGFIAKDPQGNITTLGRGGSDLTATIIGSACKAQDVQVWKDVDGILTADPGWLDPPGPWRR